MRSAIVAILVFCTILTVAPAFADTLNVPADYATIVEAVEAAKHDDKIVVAPGEYAINVGFQEKRISLVSSDGPLVTKLIPANAGGTVIQMGWGNLAFSELAGFTITGGVASHTIIVWGGAPLIHDNIFHSNIPIGNEVNNVIHCVQAAAVISRNLFYNNGGSGCVGIRSGNKGNIIVNNTFDGNNCALDMVNYGGDVYNNIISNSRECGIKATDVARANLIDYNLVYNNSINYSIADVEGANDIHADPLYVNRETNDFHLQLASPAIDAGHPHLDYDDPDGTRNDCGVYAVTADYPVANNITYFPEDEFGHVASLAPKISWSYLDSVGNEQQGYQVRIGTDIEWLNADVWNSGPVLFGESQVTIPEQILVSHTNYFLRIRLFDGTKFGDWRPDRFTVAIPKTILVPEDQPTIQSAIDASLSGDQIVVGSGRYIENIDYDSKVISIISDRGAEATELVPEDPSAHTIIIDGNISTRAEFAGFTVTGSGATNTIMVETAAPKIHDNVFRDNIPFGSKNVEVISCNDSKVIVKNNLFYNNGGIGCVGFRGINYGNVIINNTFDGNERGFFSTAGGGIAINNIVTNSDVFGIVALTETDFSWLDYNLLYGNASDYNAAGPKPGPNCISANPLYVDRPKWDFRLQNGSPAIDAGHPHVSYNDPDGTRNNMGAFIEKSCCVGIRGDVNSDGSLDIGDLVTLVDILFGAGTDPTCPEPADVNGSNSDRDPDIVDLVYMVDFLFLGGAQPVDCW